MKVRSLSVAIEMHDFASYFRKIHALPPGTLHAYHTERTIIRMKAGTLCSGSTANKTLKGLGQILRADINFR